MNKEQARAEMATISSGTIGNLTGLRLYSDIDAYMDGVYTRLEHTDVSGCETWLDVWELLKEKPKHAVNLFNNLKQATLTSSFNKTLACPEVEYTYGKSVLKVILRKEGDDPNGADANVLQASGVQKDIVFMMAYFLEHYTQVRKMTNQVSNENELKAMWKAGFRFGPKQNMATTVMAWKASGGSIMMVWNRL